MSKIALKPNASGTGVFSLEAPNSNTDRTLTLPDEAGSVLTNVSDIETQVKTATNATGSAPVYACRAWANFNGSLSGSFSIRDSGNVSSITDHGLGTFGVNFTIPMPDGNYSATAIAGFNASGGDGNFQNVGLSRNPLNTANQANFHTRNGNTSDLQDADNVHVLVIR
jgi:hypothetical protein